MPLVLSQSEVREVDRIAINEYGMPGVVLMENAGQGCTALLIKQLIKQKPAGLITIATGKGNNAGDGFVIARLLHNLNYDVRLLLFSSPNQLPADALTHWKIAEKMEIPFSIIHSQADLSNNDWLENSTWIVDALLGTGLQGEVREPIRTAIESINRAGQQGTKIFAVDLPSGLQGDTGEILGVAIQANITATFVARKPGLEKPQGSILAGSIHVINIGIPQAAIKQAQIQK